MVELLRSRRSMSCRAVALFVVASASASGQTKPAGRDSARAPQPLATVTVTATRSPVDVFSTPSPISVIDSATMQRRLPNSAIDLFRDLPGLDVTGVGTNQARPAIRGLRGQRILLLKDGVRLNNSRRQQDFGELPAIAGISGIDRVEVVRGPASVLYGSDAIGGVVNIISAPLPDRSRDGRLHGALAYRYGSADTQKLPNGNVQSRFGRLSFRADGAYRESESYDAPAGTFGDVTLDRKARVHDTGVRDLSLDVAVGLDLTARQRLTAKGEHYRANDAGFGYVDGDLLGADQPFIQILYPKQRVSRYSLGYEGTGLGTVLADRVQVTGYTQRNERDLAINVFIPFGPGTPPGAGLDSRSTNFTDLSTLGVRAEASKLLAGRHLLTYGVDAFRDRSDNNDSSTAVVRGFGPPRPSTSTRPQVPNATFRSAGVFAQTDLRLADRLSVILGGRLQDVRAAARATPRLTAPLAEAHDRTAVGAANVLVRALPSLHLVGSVGRGFRAPNLVERFFEGPTPEGSGYQKNNPTLEPETSLNVDVGARYRYEQFFADAFVFRNNVRDGIRIEATGDSVNRLPAFRNVNEQTLRYSGVEMLAGTTLWDAITVAGSVTRLVSKNVSEPAAPPGDTYSSKLSADIGYRSPGGRLWAGYNVRHNGKQKDIIVGSSPIGPELPAFTIQQARVGALLFDRGGIRNSLSLVVDNLADELYAEFSNASFFRPEPGRSVKVSWVVEF